MKEEENIIKTISVNELIKSLKDYLPLFYLLLLIVTILTKAVFYKKYNIDIFSYFDLTEYLVHLFKDLYLLIIPIVISYVLSGPVVRSVFFMRFATKSYNTAPIKFIRAGFFINYIVSSYILYLIHSPWYVYLGIILGTRIWYLYNIEKTKDNSEIKEGFIKSDLIEILIFTTILSVSTLYFNSREMLKNNQLTEIKLTSGEVIKTTSRLKIIGETNKYIFLHNFCSKKSTVIGRVKINSISYN
ncbi:hypothetical protein LNI90_11790 [Tenacibaculum dicentrarchi]|nr:hypothetical protein [Tenacibaculum dicentrarchi]